MNKPDRAGAPEFKIPFSVSRAGEEAEEACAEYPTGSEYRVGAIFRAMVLAIQPASPLSIELVEYLALLNNTEDRDSILFQPKPNSQNSAEKQD